MAPAQQRLRAACGSRGRANRAQTRSAAPGARVAVNQNNNPPRSPKSPHVQSGDVVVVKGSKKMFWVDNFMPKLLAALQAKA